MFIGVALGLASLSTSAHAKPLVPHVADNPIYIEVFARSFLRPQPSDAQESFALTLQFYFRPAAAAHFETLGLPKDPYERSVTLSAWPSFETPWSISMRVAYADDDDRQLSVTAIYRRPWPPLDDQLLKFIEALPEYAALGQPGADEDLAKDLADRVKARLAADAVVPLLRVETFQTDNRSCPALGETIATLETLDLPKTDFMTRADGPPRSVLDGTGYDLRIRSDGFSGTILFGSADALEPWAEATLAALEPCWRLRAP